LLPIGFAAQRGAMNDDPELLPFSRRSRKRMRPGAFMGATRGAVMTQKPPPVPPANRTPKGPGADPAVSTDTAPDRMADRHRHLGEQGRQGNIKQNTTNQGYQQDR
jgi:hypothetical protein